MMPLRLVPVDTDTRAMRDSLTAPGRRFETL
jgi:hypothetical protein